MALADFSVILPLRLLLFCSLQPGQPLVHLQTITTIKTFILVLPCWDRVGTTNLDLVKTIPEIMLSPSQDIPG